MSENVSYGNAQSSNVISQEQLVADNEIRFALRRYDFEIYQAQTKFLLGKILTIADACFPDKEQRKATKDLIKSAFHQQEKWVCEIMTGDRMVVASGETCPPIDAFPSPPFSEPLRSHTDS